MRLRSAASVLLTLVYCTAENNVPRWSKPDRDLGQGEWVPLNNERLNEESVRIPSAINPDHFNHALHQAQSGRQYSEEYQPKQILGSQSAPPRIAFLHPQSVNPQSNLQQPQIPPQQLLSQFLNQQISQPNLPVYSRALLRKPPVLSSNYYPQEEHFSLEPNYNQVQDFKNAQYNFDPNTDYETQFSDVDKPTGNPIQSALKTSEPSLENEQFKPNYSLPVPNKKEEVQILYVPVEMLKQQEQARLEQARKAVKNVPIPDESLLRQLQQDQNTQQFNAKETKKFRHPIQPLKDQVPAHHLPPHDKILFPTPSAVDKEEPKNTYKRPSYTSQRTTVPSRNGFYQNYNGGNSRAIPTGNREQYVEESNIQDEISEFRNTVTRRTPQKDNAERAPPTLPPPNQPPLSVFMESSTNNRIGDVLTLLKDSKTIPVLDSVGPDAPQVFVGPSNLHTPIGYIKYELPYLSSLNNNNAPPKLSEVPFFVAPLNFQPPPGFAKIPFPPPHIGSVVLSNVSNHHHLNDEINIPTPHSVERHTPNYKETFTIPADISSISPQLPSLINSLQEDEYIGSSSTESLTEPTEEPTVKYRRPTTSRRQNNRGSQRGYSSSGTTTRRPSSRQRKPSTRYSSQRVNQNTESKLNPQLDEQYANNAQYNFNSNKKTEGTPTPNLPIDQSNANQDYYSTEPHPIGHHIPANLGAGKQEQRTFDHGHHFSNNPTTLLSYSNDEKINPNDGRSGITYQGRIPTDEQPNVQHFQDSRTSEPLTHATNTQSSHFHTGIAQKTNNNYPPQEQHSLRPINNFDQQDYQVINNGQIEGQSQDGTGSLNGYEGIQYRKPLKDDRVTIQDGQNPNLNYRIRDQPAETERHIDNPSLLRTFQEQSRFSPDERGHHQSFIDVTTDKQQGSGYLENFETQNSTFTTGDHAESPESYGQTQSTNRPFYPTNSFPQTTSKTINYDDQNTNYENRNEQQKKITERPTPVRSRTRVRGRTHSQISQLPQTTPPSTYPYSEEDQKYSLTNQYSHNSSRSNSDNYDDRSQYHTESNIYTTTEQVPTSPSRKYLHSRGRRPLRPSHTTTTTASPTTTSSAPGMKYLIRTRRPTMPHTKLQPGRGRIRKPTTPTTTTTTQATTTTEYPRTLPYQWKQPVANDGYLKDDNGAVQDTVEYREPPQYQIGKTTEIRLHNTQSARDDAHQHQPRRNYPRTKVEQPQKAPIYSYDAEEETISPHKLYDSTDAPQYSSNFERTPNLHTSREHDTPEKQEQYSREYERTPKTQVSREYEPTPKAYTSREYAPTPKTYVSKDYEDTQKPHYVREYEATEKAQYSREYETTKKPHYTREYETTPKPQYQRDYDVPTKTQTYNKYESSQNVQSNRDYESSQIPQQYDDYETTNKAQYNNDYATTHKPQTYKDYEATISQTYQDYETTQKPYVPQTESKPQRTHNHSPTRASNYNPRRRPSAVSRGETRNSKYNVKPESSTARNSDSDFWNQAVTIQQSQSYVYNPDEDQLQNGATSSKQGSSNSKPALQNDYDDYYNFQEGGQYSSDQSPFPSNDQHVTYTKAKPNQEIGKANQYPEKATYDKTVSEQDKDEETHEDKYSPQQENISEQLENVSVESDVKYTSEEENIAGPLPSAERPSEPVTTLPNVEGTRKKSGKRRGTWVRVRVKKPKDVFETAESQRFSSVRDNALVPGETKSKGLEDIPSNEANSSKADSKNVYLSESVETTTAVDSSPRITSETDLLSNEEDKSDYTTRDFMSSSEIVDSTTTTTAFDLQSDSDEHTTTTSSITTPENSTSNNSQEVYKTSTTTEISLETEICYKGQCIKTKRKKDIRDIDFPVN